MVRQTLADDILGKLKSAGIKVYSLSLGGLPVLGIWELLGELDESFSLDGHGFSVSEDGSFSGYQYSEVAEGDSQIKLGGHKVSPQAVLPYALAFQLFLHDRLEPVKTENEAVDLAFMRFLDDSGLKKAASVFM